MKSLFYVFFLCYLPLFAQIGINNDLPEQALDVNGKIKVGDDATTPTEGTVRYNSATKTFEGYDGTEWVSMSYSPTVYYYEQDPLTESFSSTTRDVLIDFPYTLTIEKPGKYMCFFDFSIENLNGNTTTLSSDRIAYFQLQIYNQLEFRYIGPDVTGLPSGFQYFFREIENVQLHRIMDIPANKTMKISFRIYSNTCCSAPTSTYYIKNVKMTAIRLGD